MTRKRTRTYARILTLASLALAALAGFTSPAGATTGDPGFTALFEVTAAGQIPVNVEATTVPTDEATNLTAYNRMVVLADAARLRCGTYQVDLFGPDAPAPVIGELYPPNTPGALSFIANIVGTGVCDTPARAATDQPVNEVTAPPPAPVVDAPAAPTAPAISQEVAATSISVVRAPATLAATGAASTSTLALLGGFVIACGGLVIKLGRLIA